MDTGVPIINGAISLGLNILLAVAVLLFSSRLISMYYKHQYAQLIVSITIFGLAIFFINDPKDAIALFSNLFRGAAAKISGGGTGGAGTGQ